LHRVPFENFDVMLGREITLDAERFREKIVDERRGGFCYELNGGFASLLASLGYDVEFRGANVYRPVKPEDLGAAREHFGGELIETERGAFAPIQPAGHLLLVVTIDGVKYVADAGFGNGAADGPLLLDENAAQSDRAGTFVLDHDRDPAGTVVFRNGVPQYRIPGESRALEGYAYECRTVQTEPASPFHTGTVCTMLVGDGRITVAGTNVKVTAGNGKKTETPIENPEHLGATLRLRFGMELPDDDLNRLFGARACEPLVAAADAGDDLALAVRDVLPEGAVER
jgi:N-hydroxyarylamine O-acetyltransferase